MHDTLYQIVVDGRKYNRPDYDELIVSYSHKIDYISMTDDEYKSGAFQSLMNAIERNTYNCPAGWSEFKTYDVSKRTFTMSKSRILRLVDEYVTLRLLKYTPMHRKLESYLKAKTVSNDIFRDVKRNMDHILYAYDDILVLDAYGERISDFPMALLDMAANEDTDEVTFKMVDAVDIHI